MLVALKAPQNAPTQAGHFGKDEMVMTSVVKLDLLVFIRILALLLGLALPQVKQALLLLRDLYVA